MYIVIICFPVCGVINFEIKLGFLIKPFSNMTKKVRTKIQMPYKRKELLRLKKAFFIISLFLKHLPEIVLDLRVDL